jgi:hypothetical protein
MHPMRVSSLLAFLVALGVAACGGNDPPPQPVDPDTAPRVAVDRFSGEPATLLRRDLVDGLPAPDAPIDLDAAPFVVVGLGPGGERTTHYNLDVQRGEPINIYVMFFEGESTPVPDQLPLADYVPGVHGYTDFWRLVRVEVPSDYVANTVTSTAGINRQGFPLTVTDTIINCPVMPVGSTATLRRGSGALDTGLHRGWYKDQVFHYLTFEEVELHAVDGATPVAPLYATFNVNPPADGGGWPSGLMTEAGGVQTHAVAAALDGSAYSSLWAVQIYDNAEFAAVRDLATAEAATLLVPDAMLWNAPLVAVAAP